MEAENEEKLLRSVALKNANSILLARRRAEQDLIQAKEALERKTAELAHTLSMVRATLESTTNAIVVTSDAGRITGFNENYLAMWGLERERVEAGDHRSLLESISSALAQPREFLARVEAIIASSEESLDLLELTEGRVIERYSKAQVVGGRNVGRVWSFSDVTEMKRAEAERKALLERERYARAEAERANAMKDEFLATLSHELRTPLSAILGWSQVLRRRRAVSEADLQQGLETIERNARAQTQLIDDLLDMSRITSGQLRLDIQPVQPILFIEAAIETVQPAADAKGIRIEKRLDPAAGPITGDPNRLQQVIWNLLSNAIKFTAKEGRVQVGLGRTGSHVEITVSDTGIGIDPDFLPYVFDRFRQADASTTRLFGGLGLGLSIVKRLVELHGGTVRARSAGEGRGSTFDVRIPLTAVHGSTEPVERPQPASSKPLPLEFEHADLSGVKVLVVDDELDARILIQRVLAECRAEVLTASGADEALALLERERPHVLVSDIGMPEVDGFELLKRVRAMGPGKGGKLPAIALTAFARSEERTRALRTGFLVHVSKPVDPSELVATVASVAGRVGDRVPD